MGHTTLPKKRSLLQVSLLLVGAGRFVVSVIQLVFELAHGNGPGPRI